MCRQQPTLYQQYFYNSIIEFIGWVIDRAGNKLSPMAMSMRPSPKPLRYIVTTVLERILSVQPVSQHRVGIHH